MGPFSFIFSLWDMVWVSVGTEEDTARAYRHRAGLVFFGLSLLFNEGRGLLTIMMGELGLYNSQRWNDGWWDIGGRRFSH